MKKENLVQQLGSIWEDIKLGARKADVIQAGQKGVYTKSAPGTSAGGANAAYKPGASSVGSGLGYGQSILDPRFKQSLAAEGVTLRGTPAQFLGAYTSRLVVDAANDGTRTYWWRYNHPLAVSQAGVGLGINEKVIPSPTIRAATALAIAAPAISAAGTFDITNPEEQFRPEGYAQTYSPKGAEDRRQTGQPVQEMFERFFLGRTGDPLKYETAKQDIPSLTPQRYGNYMNYLYNDKGLLGLGIIKGTTENLQGNPEVRMLGFPVTLPMVGGFTAGTVAARQASLALNRAGASPVKKLLGTIAAAAGGSVAGVAAGNLTNAAIAAGNRPQLPTTSEYSSYTAQ